MLKISEFSESIIIAYDSLKANKIRSLLASLGVVVGISVVIMMGWAINGLDQALNQTFSVIGTDMLYIDKWDWTGGKKWNAIRDRKNITIDNVNDLTNKITKAEYVIPNINKWGTNIEFNGTTYKNLSLVGVTSDNAYTPAGDLEVGRYFTLFEDDNAENVVVIGNKVYTTLLENNKIILGKYIKIDGKKFEIIGVVKKRGTFIFDMIDNQIFIPFKTFQSVYGKRTSGISIGVKAGKADLDEVRDEAVGIMRESRNLKPSDENDFSVNETKAFQESVEQIRMTVWGAGIAMTALSFIVGMIGISNIMFVSVTERTKEIGIRKAIGAKKNTVLIQFLFEAAFLCFVGAIISLIVCSILVAAIAYSIPMFFPSISFLTPYLPFTLLIQATVISVIVGMIAGIAPAIKASNLTPIDALRFE